MFLTRGGGKYIISTGFSYFGTYSIDLYGLFFVVVEFIGIHSSSNLSLLGHDNPQVHRYSAAVVVQTQAALALIQTEHTNTPTNKHHPSSFISSSPT